MFTLWRSETEERTTDSILPGWWHCIRVLRLDESRVEVIETRINFDLWQVEKYYRGKKSRLFAPHSCWVDRKSCRQDGSITTLTGQNQYLNPPPADVFSDRLKGNEEAIQSDQDFYEHDKKNTHAGFKKLNNHRQRRDLNLNISFLHFQSRWREQTLHPALSHVRHAGRIGGKTLF